VAVCVVTETFFSLAAPIILLIDIMPLTQLVNAGIKGPLPIDFNFDAHIVIPLAVDQFKLPLAVHIAEKLNIKNFNNDSILKTVVAKTASAPHPIDLDIRPTLKAPFCYSSQELQDLIESQHYCDSIGPLPSFPHP
jgi:hypothetical protein